MSLAYSPRLEVSSRVRKYGYFERRVPGTPIVKMAPRAMSPTTYAIGPAHSILAAQGAPGPLHIPAVCWEEAVALPHRDSALPAPARAEETFFFFFCCSHHSFLGGAHTRAQPLPTPLAHGANSGAWGPGKQQGWVEVPRQGWAVVQGCCSVRCLPSDSVCVSWDPIAPESFQEVVAVELGKGRRTGHGPRLWVDSR